MRKITSSQKIIQTIEKIDLIKKTKDIETQDKINSYLFQISKDLEFILEDILNDNIRKS